jgi:catechol 2,3-dioxygenase-like lactoylglutathione lyase family enzyme
MSVLDHVSIPVCDLARAGAFYDAVLSTLGLVRRKQITGAVGYGPESRAAPTFWLLERNDRAVAIPGIGLHISFTARDANAVDAFHAAAIQAGGVDAGRPGSRPEYTAPFYGAFVIDLDGFKIEAVCRTGG